MLLVLRYLSVVLITVGASSVSASMNEQLAIVVNSADPQSRLIADYYQKKRNIPAENIIVVDFQSNEKALSKEEFQRIRERVEEKTPEHVQFYALAWSRPFRVDCMSITSAFAFGFDEQYCAVGCKPTAASAYYNSESRKPFSDFKLRPSMMLAGSSVENVFAMIDRGVRSDRSQPIGTAYLMNTSDNKRNIRAGFYSSLISLLGDRIVMQQVNADVLEDKNDVLFYFTSTLR